MSLRLSVLTSLALLLPSGAARADLLSVYGEAHTGASTGKGLGGDREDDAFHASAKGFTYGAKLGVEILLVDLWLQHDQYFDDGVDGTWTQLMTGIDLELDIGSGYFELGSGVGLALGTGQQVDPPLDNGEITDKGIIAEGRVGGGYRVAPFVSLGVILPVQVGYLVKSGAGTSTSDLGTHYSEMSTALLFYLRFNAKI
jgi:hypothetical protein